MNLLQEYRNEQARTAWWIAKHYRENNVDPATQLRRSKLRNAIASFKHAAANVFDYYQGMLFPTHYVALLETTTPGSLYRTWVTAPEWKALCPDRYTDFDCTTQL